MNPLPSEFLQNFLDEYAAATGAGTIRQLKQLAGPLQGARVVHLSAHREGDDIADILQKLIPFKQALGLDARWEVLHPSAALARCARALRAGVEGESAEAPDLQAYARAAEEGAQRLRPLLEEADFVFIHDLQPAGVQAFCPGRKGHWVWQFHGDASQARRQTWESLRPWLLPYEASVFSLAEFIQDMPHRQFIIAPGIDPLSEKNRDLPTEEVRALDARFGFDPKRPLVLQFARFGRYQDPMGVIEAYRLAAKVTPLQLVLAGYAPEAETEEESVFQSVRSAAEEDPHLHLLVFGPQELRTINALQRRADIVLQKSLREGFGLGVAEAMWKRKAVIGGDAGGIRQQVLDHFTGFLVHSPEGAALRIRYLLHRKEVAREMGERARRFIQENFLLTRQTRDYLTLMHTLGHGESSGVIDLGQG